MSVHRPSANLCEWSQAPYSKLRQAREPGTLSEPVDLAVKNEVTHFVEEARRQHRHDKKKPKKDRHDKKKPWVDRAPSNGKPRWVEEHGLKTTKFQDNNIPAKLRDNKIMAAELEMLSLKIHVSGLNEVYDCVAVVYSIPGGFDSVFDATLLWQTFWELKSKYGRFVLQE
ncbi:unnamed protein product [Phytophthora fragariaefolia]|uniref:Unnamed protein product n=1 Tax=Phytophthora fragariaefolia TaxID=1490495 RepID=A0A9W7DB13_9STRA|nr:unnamed protein product [Phytophthora fragariaefolia]